MIVRLITRRLLFLVLVLFGLSVITFTISRVVPADPARMMLGPRASKAQVERQREAMGLNDPYPKQYVDYVWGVLHGDFGKSTATRRNVSDDLRRYLPGTIEIGLYAFIFSTVLGIPLGVASAVRRDTLIDHISRFISITGLALPVFWLALMVQFLFYGTLHILPDGQRLPQGVDPPKTITSLYTIDDSANISFVPVASRWAGHEVCGRKGAWMSGILTSKAGFGLDPGSFHPNLKGQRDGYAAAVNAALR